MSYMSEIDAMLPVDCCDPLNGCDCCDRSDPCGPVSDPVAEYEAAAYGASVTRGRTATFAEQLAEARLQREKRFSMAGWGHLEHRPLFTVRPCSSCMRAYRPYMTT
jgi:hypothetical protein